MPYWFETRWRGSSFALLGQKTAARPAVAPRLQLLFLLRMPQSNWSPSSPPELWLRIGTPRPGSAWELQTLSVSNEPSSWRHVSIPLLPILVDTRHHSTRNWEDVLKYCHSLHVKSRVPFCFAYRMLRNVSSLLINGHFLFLFTGHEGSYSLIQLLSSFSL